MHKGLLSALKWIAGGFVLLVLFYQLYQVAYDPLTTGTAVYEETYQGIETTGLILREETVVTAEQTGVRRYVVADGGRVSKGGVIAEIYADSQAAQAVEQVRELEAQAQALKDVETTSEGAAVDLNLLNEKIKAAFATLAQSCAGGDYTQTQDAAAAMLALLNRRQIVTGQTQNFEAAVGRLNAQIQSLTEAGTKAVGTITAAQAGYFVSSVDGFENVLSAQQLDAITAERLQALRQKNVTVSADAVGKVVSDYQWYIAAPVPFEQALGLEPGDSLRIQTSLHTSPELPVNVVSVNKQDDGEQAVVILSCKTINGELAAVRTLPIKIITGSFAGLRVGNQAIRVVDGQTGVYVLMGTSAHFVPVKVLYSTETFSICEQASEGNRLRLYDEVILKGKNLYDGKIVG